MSKFYAHSLTSESTFSWLAKPLFFLCLVLATSFSDLQAQSSSSIAGGIATQGGLEWKSFSAIQQILQQELVVTNNELANPNVTDWSTAMLEAYRSLLTFTQTEIQVNHDMPEAIDKAFVQMQTEVVPNQTAKAMVMDDMEAKKIELIQKLTNQ